MHHFTFFFCFFLYLCSFASFSPFLLYVSSFLCSRPRSIDDVAHQSETVSALRTAIRGASLPHLVLYGPPGTGKTTCALALARELFPDARLRATRVLELNASDERGIAVVREKIKTFAAGAVSRTPRVGGTAGALWGRGTAKKGEKEEGLGSSSSFPSPSASSASRPLPPFKLIILDEADSMTPDAQSALRRTMETTSRVTRFIILCNYVSRIIEPLASRCAKFRFKGVCGSDLGGVLDRVAAAEHLTLLPGARRALEDAARGDVRRALTALQSAARLGDGTVSACDALDALGVVDPSVAGRVLGALRGRGAWIPGSARVQTADADMEIEGATTSAAAAPAALPPPSSPPTLHDFAAARAAALECVAEGYATSELLLALQRAVLEDREAPETARAAALARLADADAALVDGADETLQLLAAFAGMQKGYQEAGVVA